MTRDSLPHIAQQIHFRLRTMASTAAGKLWFAWWGIAHGAGLSLQGLPVIRRAPGAVIRLGVNCKLISSFSANSHGVTRPCYLSALTRSSRLEIRFVFSRRGA